MKHLGFNLTFHILSYLRHNAITKRKTVFTICDISHGFSFLHVTLIIGVIAHFINVKVDDANGLIGIYFIRKEGDQCYLSTC